MKRGPVHFSEYSDFDFLSLYENRMELLLSILESSFDGIYITDGSANTIWCNRSYEVVSGLVRNDVIGRNMIELEKGGVISKSASLMVLESRESVTIEQDFATGKHAVVTSNPIFDANDNIAMIVTNVRDISELYDLKEQLAKKSELNLRYKSEIEIIQKQIIGDDNFVATSSKMLELLRVVNRVAKLDTTILLLGETGVGKESVATYIFRNSSRSTGRFIKVNCAAITPSLIESELFGYEPGAFTGASKNGKMGYFEVANNGTIFLDEIGELPYTIQAKLLRVLQEQEILRVGSEKPIKINVRILAATNRDLEEMVSSHTFRQDLYYRLNVFPLTIPPLRERAADITTLAQATLDQLNKKYGMKKMFTPSASYGLLHYSWPGNVRELKNVVERAFIMGSDNDITSGDLNLSPSPELSGAGIDDRGRIDLKEILERMEKEYIEQAFNTHHNIRAAADSLGLDPATFFRKLKKYDRVKDISQF